MIVGSASLPALAERVIQPTCPRPFSGSQAGKSSPPGPSVRENHLDCQNSQKEGKKKRPELLSPSLKLPERSFLLVDEAYLHGSEFLPELTFGELQ